MAKLPPSEPELLQRMLDDTAARLSEHFRSVQIVASRVEPSGLTRSWRSGNGDWYARRSLCQEFIERDQAETLARKIVETTTPPDDGEKWKSPP